MSDALRELKARQRWTERCWRAAKRRSDPRIERFRRVYKRHRSNRLVGDLTGSTAPQLLPDRPCLQDTADDLGAFFASKISTIRSNLDRAADSGSPSDALPPEQSFLCQHKDTDLLRLRTVSTEEIIKLSGSLPAKSCPLDPMPTRLLKQCLSVLIVPITEIVNLSLSTSTFPAQSTPSSDLSSRSQLSIATSWVTTARFRISHFYQNSSKKRS